jgi:hypothetical protein
MLFEERGNWSPSLRRHYPDQVYGYYLSLVIMLKHEPSTPGTLKT